MSDRSGRIGIFGGTFNPIHVGHLRLAEDVRERFELSRILFIPTHIPPHKPLDGAVRPSHRLQMVQRAIAGNDALMCDDVELRRGGISYTIDTVRYVYDAYRFDARPFLIVGSDLMPELHTWKDVQGLVELVHFIVLVRDNYPYSPGKSDGIMMLEYSLFEQRKLQVNSSEIRELLRAGRSIRYLVTDGVWQYIHDHGLYTGNAD